MKQNFNFGYKTSDRIGIVLILTLMWIIYNKRPYEYLRALGDHNKFNSYNPILKITDGVDNQIHNTVAVVVDFDGNDKALIDWTTAFCGEAITHKYKVILIIALATKIGNYYLSLVLVGKMK